MLLGAKLVGVSTVLASMLLDASKLLEMTLVENSWLVVGIAIDVSDPFDAALVDGTVAFELAIMLDGSTLLEVSKLLVVSTALVLDSPTLLENAVVEVLVLVLFGSKLVETGMLLDSAVLFDVALLDIALVVISTLLAGELGASLLVTRLDIAVVVGISMLEIWKVAGGVPMLLDSVLLELLTLFRVCIALDPVAVEFAAALVMSEVLDISALLNSALLSLMLSEVVVLLEDSTPLELCVLLVSVLFGAELDCARLLSSALLTSVLLEISVAFEVDVRLDEALDDITELVSALLTFNVRL